MAANCRSCRAPIVWAVTPEGRRMPVDAEPVDGGDVLLRPNPTGSQDGYAPVATVVGKSVQPSLFGDDGPRYTSHFATCPNADTHRRSR